MFEKLYDDYYPIDALNKGQLRGALDPFHVESHFPYLLDFQEFCAVASLDWKDFLNRCIQFFMSDTQILFMRNCL